MKLVFSDIFLHKSQFFFLKRIQLFIFFFQKEKLFTSLEKSKFMVAQHPQLFRHCSESLPHFYVFLLAINSRLFTRFFTLFINKLLFTQQDFFDLIITGQSPRNIYFYNSKFANVDVKKFPMLMQLLYAFYIKYISAWIWACIKNCTFLAINHQIFSLFPQFDPLPHFFPIDESR